MHEPQEKSATTPREESPQRVVARERATPYEEALQLARRVEELVEPAAADRDGVRARLVKALAGGLVDELAALSAHRAA
jgi:hypothetical protein